MLERLRNWLKQNEVSKGTNLPSNESEQRLTEESTDDQSSELQASSKPIENNAVQDRSEFWIQQALQAFQQGNDQAASTAIEQALQVEQQDCSDWSIGNEFIEPLQSYDANKGLGNDDGLCIEPEWYQIWLDQGNVLLKLEQYEEALLSYNYAIENKFDCHEAWHNRGLALHNLKRCEEAVLSYDSAIEHKPHCLSIWYSRGDSLYYLERYEEAIASYDKGLSLDASDYWAWND